METDISLLAPGRAFLATLAAFLPYVLAAFLERSLTLDGRSLSMSGNITHLTDANFDQELGQGEETVAVDFWAEWCAPCRTIAPLLEELSAEYSGRVRVAKVNVDEQPGLAARYGIRSIPTLLFFKEGKVVDQVIGAVPRAHLKKKFDALA